MNSSGSRLLRESPELLLDSRLVLGITREIGVFIEDDDAPRKATITRDSGVVFGETPDTLRSHALVAILHLGDGLLEYLDRISGVHTDLTIRVRIVGKLDQLCPLGIDEVKTHEIIRITTEPL